MNNRYNIL